MSFAAQFDGARNELVFATKAEAEKYERELGSRWFGFTESEVIEVDEPVTYTFDDDAGKAVRIA